MTEQDAIRQDREASIRAAWQTLALLPEFTLVFEQDLQALFSPLAPCFQGDFNAYAAAQRDGSKQVIAHIHKRILTAKRALEDESTPAKPTQAQ